MKRVAAIAIALFVLVAGFLLLTGGDDGPGDDTYLVRAVFDNGSFAVAGEDVRVAGANVGRIAEVTVSKPGEIVSGEPGEEEQAGKAVVVLEIQNEGFQDFREDASCILRPQSLIGERYVDCRPTKPRTINSEPPPVIEPIPDGEPGEGEHLVPLENNITPVDIDALQNLQREPEGERFRLILNELGIGFAARGEDVAEIVERADPTLKQINEVLEIFYDQRKQLAKLNADSDEILAVLADGRADVSGFIRNAGVAAEATAERRPEMEEALQKFPIFLRELRSTMAEFQNFSDAALPVTRDLGDAAGPITKATKLMAPFSKSAEIALTSFGDAAEASGPILRDSDPIVRATRDLATSGVSTTKNLNLFLASTRRTGGFDHLMELIYNTNAAVNGYDSYGHFNRTMLIPNNCFDYVIGYQFECDARLPAALDEGTADTDLPSDLRPGGGAESLSAPVDPRRSLSLQLDGPNSEQGADRGSPDEAQGAEQSPEAKAPNSAAMNDVLDYLVKP